MAHKLRRLVPQMRRLLLVVLVLAVFACRRSSMHRGKEQYDVVQEGAASGVTSTINAPGEQAPAPLTATNADTTTNFTLPAVAPDATTTPAEGTLAGTLPAHAPEEGRPAAPPRVQRPRTSEPPPAQQAERREPAPATDTSATQPPPATDTAAPPAEAGRPKKDEPPPPPPTETTSTQPPR